MKKLTLITLLTLSSLLTYAQYGKLQPVKPGDTLMIIRTSKDVIDKLSNNNDSHIRKDASLIDQIEDELEKARKKYIKCDISFTPNEEITNLAGLIGVLQRDGYQDVKYYIKEFMRYYPKRNE